MLKPVTLRAFVVTGPGRWKTGTLGPTQGGGQD